MRITDDSSICTAMVGYVLLEGWNVADAVEIVKVVYAEDRFKPALLAAEWGSSFEG